MRRATNLYKSEVSVYALRLFFFVTHFVQKLSTHPLYVGSCLLNDPFFKNLTTNNCIKIVVSE